MVFKQRYSWYEDGWGEVRLEFRIADSYPQLFNDAVNIWNTRVFLLDQIKKAIQEKSGGLADHELSFSALEKAVESSNDSASITLVKLGRVPSNIIYIAFFIDADNIPTPTQMDYIGVIQTDADAEDEYWHGEHYDAQPEPVRVWKFRAKPFSSAVFSKITTEELIYGSTDYGLKDGKVPAIDSTWEASHVADVQGYFHSGTKDLKVKSLASLSHVLSKLRDNFVTGLNARFGVDIDITFDSVTLDGSYYPARWNQHTDDRARYRYLKGTYYKNYYSDVDFATTYIEDGQRLYLRPDELFSNPLEIPYINYQVIKPISTKDGLTEPSATSATNWQWSHHDKTKTFFELVYFIGFSLGMYVLIEWSDYRTIVIKFRPRSTSGANAKYLKTAVKAQLKTTAPQSVEIKSWTAYPNYLADEGISIYLEEGNDQGTFSIKRKSPQAVTASVGNLLFSLGSTAIRFPTWVQGGRATDSGYMIDYGLLAHNHFFVNNGVADISHFHSAIGIDNHIYMAVAKNGAHPDANYEPDYYYTTAAKMAVKINGETKVYDKLADYINYINGNLPDTMTLEYQLTVPGYYCFSDTADGSAPTWQISIGDTITIDSIAYVVQSITRKLSKPEVDLILTGTAKYNFDDPGSFVFNEPPHDSDAPDSFKGTKLYECGETIEPLCFVRVDSDGLLYMADDVSTHYGQVCGFALDGGISGENVRVVSSGNVYDGSWALTPGQHVFLQTLATNPTNFTQTPLDAPVGSRNMISFVAKAVATDEIEINLGLELIFEGTEGGGGAP